MSSTVPIIIPALDPDAKLLQLIDALKEQRLVPIIIVNDGSHSAARPIFAQARQKGCVILVHAENQGKGASLKDAFQYCLQTYPDLVGVITADSDGQHLPADIAAGRLRLLAEPEVMFLGSRDFSGEGIPFKSRFGNQLTRFLMAKIWHVDIPDTQTGLRAIPKAILPDLVKLPGDRFEYETDMIKTVAQKHLAEIKPYKIATVYESKTDHATHFRPVADSVRIYRLFFASFTRFILSSCSSAVLDLLLFAVFSRLLAGFPAYVAAATILARIISAAYNYWINYAVVFESQAKHLAAGSKYLLLAVAIMLASASLTSGLHVLLPAWPLLLVKMLVDGGLFLASYLIQRKFVYVSLDHEGKGGRS